MQRATALPVPSLGHRPRRAEARALLGRRLTNPAERPLLLWQALWFPFSIWSDTPVPALPHREASVPTELGLAGQAVVGGIDRIRRRLWLTHAAAAICRGLWLGLLFGTLVMLIDVVGGPTFNPTLVLSVGGVLLITGLFLAAVSQPSRRLTTRMLDRSFGLHERLTTALDDLGLGVPRPGERAPIVYLQMADAANAVAVLRNDRRLRPAIPTREIVLIVFMALLLTTLAFARGLGGGLPELATARVPVFTPAVELPVVPEPSAAELDAATKPLTVQEVLERSDRSSRARRDLQALAAALSDHALTRSAADQIARGDFAAAGDQLRESAAQTSNLSEGARSALSSDLQRASEVMDPDTNGLQEATEDAAKGLQLGDEPSRTEMRDLADAVEKAGNEVVPQGELASQMRSARQSQPQGSANDNQPASEATGGDPSDASAQASTSGDPGSGADAESSTGSESQESGSGGDPGDSQAGQAGGAGERGQANAPGDGEGKGQGENASAGDGSRRGSGATGDVSAGDADAETARLGGGAGTGNSPETGETKIAAASGSQAASAGEDPANPDVSPGNGAEADPSALTDASQQVALPATQGQQGVQTASDGGSALRGSGSGVTAGSGFATQGEIGEAGPDSNRVPPRHRETVERYFSAGGDE